MTIVTAVFLLQSSNSSYIVLSNYMSSSYYVLLGKKELLKTAVLGPFYKRTSIDCNCGSFKFKVPFPRQSQLTGSFKKKKKNHHTRTPSILYTQTHSIWIILAGDFQIILTYKLKDVFYFCLKKLNSLLNKKICKCFICKTNS